MALQLHAYSRADDYSGLFACKIPPQNKETEQPWGQFWIIIFIITLPLDWFCYCKQFFSFLFSADLICSAFFRRLDNDSISILKNHIILIFKSYSYKSRKTKVEIFMNCQLKSPKLGKPRNLIAYRLAPCGLTKKEKKHGCQIIDSNLKV